ncbi:bifunctional aconitate hydratase 2/2-methylisocitrate dehydratase [Helicobacter sp. MIT 14-3879]|uniref:bifunctional aconitate hydratase 2/2-methylisocitrate dehydratase n=1 Tax=Helicobacter sp. MIT 14-3879 TaxID=2040649 RepID=UPI000E1E7EC9|nr:bifunctional aconitate hydratase 2/2-methylisocitrate dehydratase [Helicobacter sp. MIT 14-3879]RDU62456.1 bifunctional aconitate hydratase 2/2-methylisocitrate dehydratase [Helicobacter sp. MIT 14-3879]
MEFKAKYLNQKELRARDNVPPLAINTDEIKNIIELIKSNKDVDFAKDLLINRVSPGVDESAKIKAEFLGDILEDRIKVDSISKQEAIKILSTMVGGYNIKPLIIGLSDKDFVIAKECANALKNLIFVYDNFDTIAELSKNNSFAREVIESWANAEWFLNKKPLDEKIEVVALKIDGETNTDDLSPAGDAFTRSDIPLHAQAMLKNRITNSKERLDSIKKFGKVAYVGDVVGTGSSRKSACNSIMWHFGDEIPFIPNKKSGGIVIGGVIAPIFFNTCQDSGCLPIVANVENIKEGDKLIIYPYKGIIECNGKEVTKFTLEPNTIFDEIRSGGRINLIIGRKLTNKAREFLKMGEENIFAKPIFPRDSTNGYTLAQKIIGMACGKKGVRVGEYCEPITTTVGSQDTTGAMTRDEIKEMAALKFSSDFVMQSFCHTAAYPKDADVSLQATLPSFITSRGGVSLRPKDGVIHSWLNRFTLPDTLGTGGDSHTRFPIGISFPAGSGLVAFAAVNGIMPLNVPPSVLVRFKGELNEGITLRDLVNAIPYYAIKKGLLSVEKKNKKNIFNGKILEIEGLPKLKVEQAFELSDASAERSAAACVIKLDKEPIIEYLKSNIALINAMINNGYESKETLQRRAKKMQDWIDNPILLEADSDAQYEEIIEIDLKEITEPIVACPNDPDDVATLSEVLSNTNRPHLIDEVFLGSCMTNIGLFRAFGEVIKGEGQLNSRIWVAPPTKMDEKQLMQEGYYAIFGTSGARMEAPGCSLCMGNQARVKDNSVVFSTSTRNFDNRMGKGAKVYLGSAELAAVCAIMGKIPNKEEYLDIINKKIDKKDQIYTYLNFNLIDNFSL